MGRSLTTPGDITNRIKAEATALGFDLCRVTSADLPKQVRARLKSALNAQYHGTMDWMEQRTDERSHPQSLWPDAKSVLMLGVNYGPAHDPLDDLKHTENGVISVYARNEDYHDLIKKRLKSLGRWMASTFGGELKVFVDTAPVMEKPLAAQSGLGWQGKHTNLVNRDYGSWLFLGSIYTTLELTADAAETENCGSCQACLDICPTDAFPAPFQLDARKCISYLTIEHKGTIPKSLREKMGNRIYGCDDCLAVCPWNKFAKAAHEAKLIARDDLSTPSLKDLAGLDDPSFRAFFRKSPIKRIGRDRFIRNVMIAIGNSNDSRLLESLTPRLTDTSAHVRSMAAWAWGRLNGDRAVLAEVLEKEDDEIVRQEMKDAMQ